MEKIKYRGYYRVLHCVMLTRFGPSAKYPKNVDITEYKYVLLMKHKFTYKPVGVMTTRFGPFDKYVELE